MSALPRKRTAVATCLLRANSGREQRAQLLCTIKGSAFRASNGWPGIGQGINYERSTVIKACANFSCWPVWSWWPRRRQRPAIGVGTGPEVTRLVHRTRTRSRLGTCGVALHDVNDSGPQTRYHRTGNFSPRIQAGMGSDFFLPTVRPGSPFILFRSPMNPLQNICSRSLLPKAKRSPICEVNLIGSSYQEPRTTGFFIAKPQSHAAEKSGITSRLNIPVAGSSR